MKHQAGCILIVFGILSFDFRIPKKSTPPLGCWMHSHEEDQKNADSEPKTYRPCSFSFPASRGRSGFILKKEGEIGLISPNKIDGRDTIWGSWTLIGPSELKIAFSETRFSRLKWKKEGRKKLKVELK